MHVCTGNDVINGNGINIHVCTGNDVINGNGINIHVGTGNDVINDVYFLSYFNYVISCTYMHIYICCSDTFLTFVLADEGSRAEAS